MIPHILLIFILNKVWGSENFDCSFASTYPKQYTAYKLQDHQTIKIDGLLDDKAWHEVEFTDIFVDINTTTLPRFETRAKIRWDENYLYIGAKLNDPDVWANISSTCHCLNSSQDQVIYHDNDFEVFVDPAGCTHNYKEFEVNAASASWDLLLNKPYNDGGYENSSREDGSAGFDMVYASPYPLIAKSFVFGKLNVPGSSSGWSVEVALPLASLIVGQEDYVSFPIQNGDYWRLDFSRVEWQVEVIDSKYYLQPSCQSCPAPGTPNEDNWVWSPISPQQPLTSTTPVSAAGHINMHLPERWGFIQFSDEKVNTAKSIRSPDWTVRSVAMALYYAQHAYADNHGGFFTSKVNELYSYVADKAILDGTCAVVSDVQVNVNSTSFLATFISNDEKFESTVSDDRLLLVKSK